MDYRKFLIATCYMYMYYTYVCSAIFGLPSRMSLGVRNCTRCGPDRFKLGLAERRRIDIIRNRIISNLGSNTRIPGVNSSPRHSNRLKTPRLSKISGPERKIKRQKINSVQETMEIVSFSNDNGEVQKKNVLTFTIHMNNNQGALEALGAHLFVLLRKRRRKPRRGKQVTLQVMKVASNSSNYDFLTIVRTRVKKTRWQKISLPVTLIQSLLESNSKTLQLKVICKRCGKSVRPVLKRGRIRNHLRRRKRKRKRKRRRNMRRSKRKFKKKARSGKTRDSIRPFLVISTRYRYYR